jgi:glycosyltransferase involved in cell wall biosynthesis
MLAASGAGIAVAPDDADAFVEALRSVLGDPAAARAMGEAGRRWVEQAVSPAAVAAAYERVVAEHRRG